MCSGREKLYFSFGTVVLIGLLDKYLASVNLMMFNAQIYLLLEDEQEAAGGDQLEDASEIAGGDQLEDANEQKYPVVTNSSDVDPASNRKSKKKKKKNKEKSASQNPKAENFFDLLLEDLSISRKPSHQIGPENIQAVSDEAQTDIKKHVTSSILLVDPRYLKAENELRKIFGSKVVNSFENHHTGGSSRQIRGVRRAAHNPRKTILISPSSYWPRWDGSMSMVLLETKDHQNYFR